MSTGLDSVVSGGPTGPSRLGAARPGARGPDRSPRPRARSLHDELGSALAAAADLVARHTAESGGSPHLAAARRALRQAMDISGHLSGGPVRATALPSLLGSLRAFTAAGAPAGLDVRLSASGDERLLPDICRRELLLAVREALGNSFRHAHADHVTVAVRCEDRWASATVTDDGLGFDADQLLLPGHRCPGLRASADRIDDLGGRLTVESKPGVGTRVDVRLPLRPQ
ncbi:sensor histidine kinase [Streptomyces sp. NPDC059070]|uniref:sensor histidine kinase n=1 Tax=unclassified Streptomyces TaxID=2593676 RepID=UPI0034E1E659